MASQRFCLRWNNHQSNLLTVFDQLLHAETFTDVTLAIDGQYLKAHKVIYTHTHSYFLSIIFCVSHVFELSTHKLNFFPLSLCSLSLFSIASTTRHFFSSFFRKKKLYKKFSPMYNVSAYHFSLLLKK